MRHSPASKAKVRRWAITPPQSTDTQPTPPAAAGAAADPLHGYSLHDIDHLARLVLRLDRWYIAGDIDERFDAVRHAIVEVLLTSSTAPTRLHLLNAGTVASDTSVRGYARSHGRDVGHGKLMPGFYRYWATAHRGTSPETRVVEWVALTQIWPLLRPSEQRAITALAATEDFAAAAAALGVTEANFRVIVSTGRRRFLKAWHEGETPSRQWRTDRRVSSRAGLDHLGRTRLTTVQVEAYRERHHAGESITALAKEAGLSKTGLSRLLSGKSKPAPVIP